MLLYFYMFLPNEGRVVRETAEVKRTEKTYTSMKKGDLPFLYKRRLLKTELPSVTSSYPGFACVLDQDNPDTVKRLFRDYLTLRYDQTAKRARQCRDQLEALEDAQWEKL